jgi:hypothetical protein
MGKVERIEYDNMQQGPEGLMKIKRKTICFLGQSIIDINNTITNHYKPMNDFPVGDFEHDITAIHPPLVMSSWSWGHFRMTNGIRTMKGAMQNPEETLLFNFQELQGPPCKHFEGTMVQAKRLFKLLENNPDIMLYVQFDEFMREML